MGHRQPAAPLGIDPGIGQLGFDQDGAGQGRAIEHRAPQATAGQVGAGQVGLRQIAPAKIESGQKRAAQIEPAQRKVGRQRPTDRDPPIQLPPPGRGHRCRETDLSGPPIRQRDPVGSRGNPGCGAFRRKGIGLVHVDRIPCLIVLGDKTYWGTRLPASHDYEGKTWLNSYEMLV